MDVFATETVKASDRSVSISAAAAKRLGEIFGAEEKPNLMLRVSVSGGGCSGFQYSFEFAEVKDEDDYVFERNGIKVIVDDTSMDYLAGSEIDFVTEMVGSSFQVNNPNAKSGCGCGASFSM
ncbi:MAG: Iron-sulfur cluster insertion protein ErpA [Alphaproteobacteria bacterium MarineAlpha4_Bin2]|nr:MAG: Iron-sulfur cluster insertion protein ErpA [Alphaproteobacteria bacterium MarineAlpha4_Bin2]|tara:strand:- start:576 stop:941 length:366 start_codon:yes stop_codon:yes gene_type:complete